MVATVETFRYRFPEFADKTEFPDLRIQVFLDDAVNAHIGTDEARWLGKYDLVHSYVGAHLLALSENSAFGDTSAKAGPVTAKSAGGVSLSYGAVAKDRSDGDDLYMTTTYGQQFIALRGRCFGGVLTVCS